MNPIVAYFAGAVAVAAVAWFSAFAGSGLWPASVALILPAWSLGSALFGSIDAGAALIPLIGAMPFLLVGLPLTSRTSETLWPTLVFVGLLVALSLLYFATSWSYGVRYQGAAYTVGAAAANGVLAAVCLWLCWRLRRRPRSYASRYVATLAPSVWLAYCSFPWLGETP